MPGGYGEMDLYYCDLGDDGWSTPVNLGPAINTPKNESFPFAGNYGKLYFASDGHKGFGRKDLFYSSEINGIWINPVHLDSAINSPADDFGLVTDSTFSKGYFSSNRLKTDDIFSFVSAPVQFTSCDSLKENNYCFTFYDERHQLIDTIPVTYLWDFGNGIKMTGTEAKYCFPGPGKYSVKLSIFDELTGSPIAEQVEYKVDLKDIEQAYINSYNIGIADEPMSFDGSKTNLKNFRITDYIWNFGEGFKPGGQFMNRSFKKKGEYSVYLGVLGEKDSLGVIPKKCVTKRIRICDKYQELELPGEGKNNTINGKTDSIGLHDKTMQIRLLFMNDLTERQKTKIKASLSELQKHVVSFNTAGISTLTYPFLDKIVEAMNGNPDVRLEIIVHSANAEVPGDLGRASERYARELAFFFRNRGLKKDVFQSRGFGSAPSLFIPVVREITISDGTIEFIFMKN
jgi:PKD repeat protein